VAGHAPALGVGEGARSASPFERPEVGLMSSATATPTRAPTAAADGRQVESEWQSERSLLPPRNDERTRDRTGVQLCPASHGDPCCRAGTADRRPDPTGVHHRHALYMAAEAIRGAPSTAGPIPTPWAPSATSCWPAAPFMARTAVELCGQHLHAAGGHRAPERFRLRSRHGGTRMATIRCTPSSRRPR
jgi:hypothetical protein